MLLDRLRVHAPGALCTVGLAVTGLWPLAAALAQPAAPAASASGAEMTPAERAKRDGDKVFHWILIHAEKPRKPVVAAAKEEKPMPVVRLKAPARPAADESTAERSLAPAPVAAAQPIAAKPPELKVEPDPAPIAAPTPAPIEAPSVTASPVAAPAVIEEDVAEVLKPLSQVEPSFPAALVRTLRTGQVKVMFTVLPDGSVAEPSVVGSSNPRLNPAALAAVTQWRFAPVRKPQHGLVDLGFNIGE